MSAILLKPERSGRHRRHLTAVPAYSRIYLITIGTRPVATYIHCYVKLRVSIALIEISYYLPVEDTGLRSREHPYIIKDAGQSPIVLSLKVIAVTIFQHKDRKIVSSRLYIFGYIILCRLLGTLIITHLTAVDPDE